MWFFETGLLLQPTNLNKSWLGIPKLLRNTAIANIYWVGLILKAMQYLSEIINYVWTYQFDISQSTA